MSHTPTRIVTSDADIAHLAALIEVLHDAANVRVLLDDGAELTGTVSARPTIEIFRDVAGNEGHNSLLRLDDPQNPASPHYLWLDAVRDVIDDGAA